MELNYQSYGTGPSLIILHGLFGMLDNWHTVARLLSADFRVFAVDQRNHGRSPHSAEFNYRVMASDMRDFMDQHGLGSAFLLGHSMGGKTAMETALCFSERVDKLVVIDIAPREYPAHHDSILDALTSTPLTGASSRQDVENALATKIADPAVRQFLMKNLARNEQGGFRWKLNLPVIAAHYSEIMSSIRSPDRFTKPVLVVRGTKSSYVSDTDITELRTLFPNLRVAEFNTGHWVHAEAPEGLSTTVTDFLKDPAP